ncbi:MAG TPA: DUF3597 domain-containing protein [Xanthobacteraceae bacterium]|nr:DUF3597 domain-containing protein [Xanthobacteraceae bacterium]
MSIFGSIMSAIFGKAPEAQAGTAKDTTASPPTVPGAGPSGVDVEGVLTQLAAAKTEKLDWRHSIVDLMKVLDLDSSFAARKQLAMELNYKGDTKDSAAMNIWLHKQVMQKLADNGGKVPAELMH